MVEEASNCKSCIRIERKMENGETLSEEQSVSWIDMRSWKLYHTFSSLVFIIYASLVKLPIDHRISELTWRMYCTRRELQTTQNRISQTDRHILSQPNKYIASSLTGDKATSSKLTRAFSVSLSKLRVISANSCFVIVMIWNFNSSLSSFGRNVKQF